MLTLNLITDCVTRDTLSNVIRQDKIKILQYPCSTNIISMACEKKGAFEIQPKQLEKFLMHNFYRKGVCFDYNKSFFDYLFLKKSDYIAVSFTGGRFNLLKSVQGHILSKTFPDFYQNPDVIQLLGLSEYKEVSVYDISDVEWQNAVDTICSKLLQHYVLNQIIYHKHYGALEYNNNGALLRFPEKEREDICKINQLQRKIDNMFLKNLDGCHVIEFPNNVVANKKHIWGLSYLHYVDEFYKYSEDAFKIIFNSTSVEKEKEQLSHLLENYNHIFELLYDKLALNEKLNSLKYRYKLAVEANNFSKKLSLDVFGKNTFRSKIEQIKRDNNTVSVLKCQDTVGQIFLKALASYDVQVIFETPKPTLQKLSDEEFQRCRSADLIICADVHNTVNFWRGGVQAVSILYLLDI